MLAEAEPLPAGKTHQPQEAELAGIFYTGGTTGRPKGVMLTHRTLALSALHNVVAFEYSQGERHLHASPMFHSADCSQAWAITLIGGAHIFLPAFDPGVVLQTIAGYRATTTLMVPTMLLALLNHPQFATTDLGSLRRVLYGAAPVDRTLLERALAAFPCPLWQGLGSAETGPLLAVLRPEEHTSKRLAAAGRAIPGVELKIVDDQDRELAAGETGEIAVRGNLMAGYWKQPEETRRVLHHDFYHTGDMAYCDDESFIFIVDRKKDMVISGGENIYTIEVEKALARHPAVMETAVFGIPDQKWGEAVHALVVLRDGQKAAPEELISFVKSQIAAYKAPHSLEIVQNLPKSGAGKILKNLLREPYWAGRARKV
jgi:long-chain acyl-CoA synthetase